MATTAILEKVNIAEAPKHCGHGFCREIFIHLQEK
jgi:hypothetical protein